MGTLIDFPLVVGSFLVAIIVGLTGMGGGALMTPMMMLFLQSVSPSGHPSPSRATGRPAIL
ncbi:hypothetical protein [Nonomuraea dietziae]|uniref:hypothetical protein n=1 Tax=Nonomuraea dietziae TaxID=65515 RepID=UPI0031E174F7